jgi:hypothetical protein
MEGLIVARWRGPTTGREKESWALAGEMDALMERWIAEGKITGFEWVVGFTGRDGHMAILRGEPSALVALSMDPELLDIIMKATWFNDDFGWDFALSGSTATDAWPAVEAALAKL